MCFIVIQVIIRSFFYLRIFPGFTPIVAMLTSVVYDLRIFLFFYFLLIIFLSQVYSVLGFGMPGENAKDFKFGIDPEGVA